ncbi:MAG TPA: NB-ARC domain-containing protein, partial [Mycobacteriales bacterium]|nr:NB-ARC domain-containing protein [Mycobacteriales bacterium]
MFGSVVQARAVTGDIHIHHSAGESAFVTPSQLPPVPAHFTGRTGELAELDRVLDEPESGAVRLVVISGAGGVGKTALGLRWLHHVADRFGGARLFADLGARGVTAPVSPGEVLGRFLRAFGVPAEQVPADLSEQVALYRTVTARGRTVVFLDDALTAAQVRPLVPSAGGLVLVTSRGGLGGLSLDGARRLWLHPLEADVGVELFTRLVGSHQANADPDAVREVARLCGGFPIAIRVAAAQIALRPRWTVRRLARELGSGNRLAAFSVEEDQPVRSALDLSYEVLTAPAARLYRLLCLHPGPDFGTGVVCAALDVSTDEGEDLVDELLRASVLTQGGNGRFRFHDLVRVHARGRADSDETPAARRAALRRMLDWYLHAASAADVTLTPYRERLPRDYRYVPPDPESFADRDRALGWLEDQRENLVAAIHAAGEQDHPSVAWQLADAMWPLLLLRKHYRDWID